MPDPTDPLSPGDRGEMTLARLEARLRAWHLARYQTVSPRAVPTFAKLEEEIDELKAEVFAHKGVSPDKVAEEAADVAIVLFHLCRAYGVSLAAAVVEKLGVIERRLAEPDFGRMPEVVVPEPAWYDLEQSL